MSTSLLSHSIYCQDLEVARELSRFFKMARRSKVVGHAGLANN